MKYNSHIGHDYERRGIGACGKVLFSKKDAATKRNYLLKIGKEEYLRIYACSKCGGKWHLTSKERTP